MNTAPTSLDGFTVTSSSRAPALFSGGEGSIVAASAPCVSQVEMRGTRGDAHEGVNPFPRFVIGVETPGDIASRDALLDRAMGPRWRKKSSEKLRRGRLPAEGLAFVARDEEGAVVGTVRLWNVLAGEGARSALLLGPLAVAPALKSAGLGSALMRHATAEAKLLGHSAILLVGDAAYYARFGFSAAKTERLAMPGPYEKHRFLALELSEGTLDGAKGVLRPAGRKIRSEKVARAA